MFNKQREKAKARTTPSDSGKTADIASSSSVRKGKRKADDEGNDYETKVPKKLGSSMSSTSKPHPERAINLPGSNDMDDGSSDIVEIPNPSPSPTKKKAKKMTRGK
jgi:hypothetical protein